ncbi:hypothetical protein OWV82_001321 [Melia azedarach]|uniref:Uncharacterized protein n=1 Tax=Melia azedarach TaxID=155640 RepID=A0ACC1YY18_MELAZ|nr:hypothetical protein OWV82_001321 [Melia azedarach]
MKNRFMGKADVLNGMAFGKPRGVQFKSSLLFEGRSPPSVLLMLVKSKPNLARMYRSLKEAMSMWALLHA